MALDGFSKVAVVKYGCCLYHFALYDDDINVGDTVVLSGGSTPTTIEEIITKEEAKVRFKKDITQEVIGKVDTTKYLERVAKREEKKKLKAEMDKRKKEIQKLKEDEYFAEIDEKFAELYNKYMEL